MEKDFTVSEHFVRYAFEAANKLVYQHRMERYKNAAKWVIDGIEMRNEMIDDFIDNYILSMDRVDIDAYDIVNDWYSGDEQTYGEIRHQIWLDEYQDSEEEGYEKLYTGTSEQNQAIYDWCADNGYWYDDTYELAVQDAFNF